MKSKAIRVSEGETLKEGREGKGKRKKGGRERGRQVMVSRVRGDEKEMRRKREWEMQKEGERVERGKEKRKGKRREKKGHT